MTSPAPTRPTLSLELFPPRSSAAWGRIDRLLATAPDFVSVTYRPRFLAPGGAGEGADAAPARPDTAGSRPAPAPAGPCPDLTAPARSDPAAPARPDTAPTDPVPRVRVVRERNAAEDVAAHVISSSQVPLMAHLTCIGYTRRDTVEIVSHFLAMGVRRFLALRGDPPPGFSPQDVHGELRYATDLVQVIREVEASYFGDDRRHVTIAVAAYPAAADHLREVEVLAAKQAAGADLAITQVFYEPEDYVALVRACTYAGVTIPILPGVIPLTDLTRLTRLESLTGVAVPRRLRDSLSTATGASLVARGVDATLGLSTALLEAGAPGLHLYTFNRTRPALDIISHLRLGRILDGAAPDREVRDAVDRGYLQATPGRGPSFLRRGGRAAAGAPLQPAQPHTTETTIKENA